MFYVPFLACEPEENAMLVNLCQSKGIANYLAEVMLNTAESERKLCTQLRSADAPCGRYECPAGLVFSPGAGRKPQQRTQIAFSIPSSTCQDAAKEVGKRVRSLYLIYQVWSLFGNLFYVSVTFLFTFLPDSLCQAPFAAG